MEFDEAWLLLERAAAVGDGLTKEEAMEGIRSGAFSLMAHGGSAALVAKFPGLWRIGLAGGDLDELRELEARIDEERRAQGVRRLQIIGREGWRRALPGYSLKAVVLEKE